MLTNCLEDTDNKLPWDLEPAGWDENDPELNARQERQYVLNLPDNKLPMTFPKVFEGEPTVDYVKVSDDEAGVDEFEYGTDDPCEKYQKTKVIDIYERPDGSLYQRQSEDYGEPVLVDENVCTYNNVTVASAWTKYRTHHGGSWSASWYYADVVVTREDGEVVKTERLDARTQHERYGGSYEVWCNNTIWCSTSHIPPMSDAIANSYGSGAGYPWPQQ
ncbi:hypothetical protein [Thalassospira sp. CH_XMU1420-2]|uniref:hypothetical protein n=1 Tax=Thalassospira sp. CH_XMU1420-2 TaxID=3107769 RepID=UPI003009C70A